MGNKFILTSESIPIQIPIFLGEQFCTFDHSG